MPRKAPTEIIETRISFGNFERQFITEVKTDIEKAVKVAVVGSTVATVGTGLVVAGGVGYMGYFIMNGLKGFSLGLDDALDPLTSWYRKWFTFTNSKTGKREAVATNWYDYIFNNQEADQMRADNPLPSSGDGDKNDVVDWSALETVGEVLADTLTVGPDEKLRHENTGGKGTADYEEGEGSNWPFTTSWWPF
jgi:hypothetical protein